MREPLLAETECEWIDSSEKRNPRTSRRQFLQTIGIAGVGLTFSARYGFAASSKAVDESRGEAIWRDRVTGFVFTVCGDRRAQVISSRLAQADMGVAPAPRNFHSFFSAPFVFVGMTIDPEKVTCGNGFEVRSFPFYDIECPCRSTNDLNAFEIRSISNAEEVGRFGCVLAPASYRMPMEHSDRAGYRRLASEYGLNPDDFNIAYKRVFTGEGRARFGYYVTHKTRKGATGKPLSDLLLESTDF